MTIERQNIKVDIFKLKTLQNDEFFFKITVSIIVQIRICEERSFDPLGKKAKTEPTGHLSRKFNLKWIVIYTQCKNVSFPEFGIQQKRKTKLISIIWK